MLYVRFGTPHLREVHASFGLTYARAGAVLLLYLGRQQAFPKSGTQTRTRARARDRGRDPRQRGTRDSMTRRLDLWTRGLDMQLQL